jgi:putative transposase
MPRPPRINVPNVTLHIVQRGNDRNRTFFDADDYRAYLLLLSSISRRFDTSVHAYVLMSNHVHLLMTSRLPGGVSATMQQLGSSYARHINRRYERTGSLWEGRFRSSPVDTDFYCLACYRYIELNPVRAGIVTRPDDYAWSSYRENTGRRALAIVEQHPSFVAMGRSEELRILAYRALVAEALSTEAIGQIRMGTVSGRPVGSPKFVESLEQRSGLDLSQRSRGRPKNLRSANKGALTPFS